ncbi:hypothetical protein NOVO_01220 [Rickettsiales bacterium Ac37b]|nr:hypothetical protein NOVO_01220 [Rickettsiales bacterium Ac37b]
MLKILYNNSLYDISNDFGYYWSCNEYVPIGWECEEYDVRGLNYTIFIRNEILFEQEYFTNETRVSSIEYRMNTLTNSNLYNQVLADQLIIYFLNYVKITGVITIDHYAKLSLVAPFGIDITEADFLGLDVEINACHSTLHGSNKARVLKFNSLCNDYNILYNNTETQSLYNKFTLLGNVETYDIYVNDYSNLYIGGIIKSNIIDIAGTKVVFTNNSVINGKSYINYLGEMVFPGAIRIRGAEGEFAPYSKIYYEPQDLLFSPENTDYKKQYNKKKYTCYAKNFCLNNKFKWLLNSDFANKYHYLSPLMIDRVNSVPIIYIEFDNKLNFNGDIEGLISVSLVAKAIHLGKQNNITSKYGPIKIIAEHLDIYGFLFGPYLDITTSNLYFHSINMEINNLNILAVNVFQYWFLKAEHICIITKKLFQQMANGILECQSCNIEAEQIINEGVIRTDYGIIKAVTHLNNTGNITSLTTDKMSSIYLSLKEGNLTSPGNIVTNYQIKIESLSGDVEVNSITSKQNNIYLYGIHVNSQNLTALEGMLIQAKQWSVVNLFSKTVDFTGVKDYELISFEEKWNQIRKESISSTLSKSYSASNISAEFISIAGKINTEFFSVTSNVLGFETTSVVNIKYLIANLTSGLIYFSESHENVIGDLYQLGGDFRFEGANLLVSNELKINSPEGKFINYGNLLEAKKITVKVKEFDNLFDHHIHCVDCDIKAEGAIYNAGSIIADKFLRLISNDRLINKNYIKSTNGNVYITALNLIKSGDFLTEDQKIDGDTCCVRSETIEAKTGKVTLITEGIIHTRDVTAYLLYTESKEYYNHAKLAIISDWEMHTEYYYNGYYGNIQVGGIWHILDNAPQGMRKLSLNQDDNIWNALQGINFQGKEWIQTKNLELKSLTVTVDQDFKNIGILKIHGNLSIDAKGTVLNQGVLEVDQNIYIVTHSFYNHKPWNVIFKVLDIHQAFEYLEGHYKLILPNHFKKRRNDIIGTFPFEIPNDLGKIYARNLVIIAEDFIHNIEGGVFHVDNNITLQSKEILSKNHNQKNAQGNEGYEIFPASIEAENGNIQIYADNRIYHIGSDVIAYKGKIYEYARSDILHEAAHEKEYALSKELGFGTLILLYTPSRPANVYAAQGFDAYSEHGTIIAAGANILAGGEIRLIGKNIIQYPLLIGKESYLGGVTTGADIYYNAEENLKLAGIFEVNNNIYLRAGNKVEIESLQHAYIERYIWTKNYKEIIYNLIVEQTKLVAGQKLKLECGTECRLKGVMLLAQGNITIDSPHIVHDSAYITAENYLTERKKKGLLGNSKYEVKWNIINTKPTIIYSDQGYISEYAEQINMYGANIFGKLGVYLYADKGIKVETFNYINKVFLHTKSSGLFAPKLDREKIQSKINFDYNFNRIKVDPLILQNSIKSLGHTKGVYDLAGPLSFTSDVLTIYNVYKKVRASEINPATAYIQTMLSMLPSINFNFGTIKASGNIQEMHHLLNTIKSNKIHIEAGEKSHFIGTEISAANEAEIYIHGDVLIQAAVGNTEQKMELISTGPVVSLNFNGMTVAFGHSQATSSSYLEYTIPSLINAPKVFIEVDGDLSLKSAYIKGEKVKIQVAKKLLIESMKDRSISISERSNLLLGVYINWAGKILPSISVSQGHKFQSTELVKFIAGISGTNVNVIADAIQLNGAEIFGKDNLHLEGKVRDDNIEVIQESLDNSFSFTINPNHLFPLTSIGVDFNQEKKEDLISSGIDTNAEYMAKSKGKKYLSFLGNNIIMDRLKSLYDWITASEVKSDSTVSSHYVDGKLSYSTYKEPAPEKREDKVLGQKKQNKKNINTEKYIFSKIYSTEYLEIDRAVDELKISGIDKEEIKQELHKFTYELIKSGPERRKEIMVDLLNLIQPEKQNLLSTIQENIIQKANAFGPVTPAVAVAFSCLNNPVCNTLLLSTAITMYHKILSAGNGVGTILSTPIPDNQKMKIFSTPPYQDLAPQIFATLSEPYQNIDQDFQEVKLNIPLPGFDIHNDMDMNILMKEDWDEWEINNYDKTMNHDRFGKFYRDPKAESEDGNRIWWSKDRAKHGGSEWKVFEETAKVKMV